MADEALRLLLAVSDGHSDERAGHEWPTRHCDSAAFTHSRSAASAQDTNGRRGIAIRRCPA